jgi:hypothetical protein
VSGGPLCGDRYRVQIQFSRVKFNNQNKERKNMRMALVAFLGVTLAGCATLTNDPMVPVAFSFSDGSSGQCKLQNKRGTWQSHIPASVSIRRSDDQLKYDCETEDGRKAFGSLESTIGAKIVASAVFLDLGITDAITDKHREYPASFVIPIEKAKIASP